MQATKFYAKSNYSTNICCHPFIGNKQTIHSNILHYYYLDKPDFVIWSGSPRLDILTLTSQQKDDK